MPITRLFSSNLLFTGTGAPLANGVLQLNDSLKISAVLGPHEQIPHIAGLAYYPGILIPGLVWGHGPSFTVLSAEFVQLNPAYRKLWLRGVQAVSAEVDLNAMPCAVLQDNFTEQLALSAQKGEPLNLGVFKPGNTPGIIHVEGYDFVQHRLLPQAKLSRLL